MGVETFKAIIRKTFKGNHVMTLGEITRKEKRLREEEPKVKETIHNKYADQKVSIDSTSPDQTREKLLSLLRQYKHVFAWKPIDMVGINRKIIEHSEY